MLLSLGGGGMCQNHVISADHGLVDRIRKTSAGIALIPDLLRGMGGDLWELANPCCGLAVLLGNLARDSTYNYVLFGESHRGAAANGRGLIRRMVMTR